MDGIALFQALINISKNIIGYTLYKSMRRLQLTIEAGDDRSF